jgi:hypothetical protein
MIDELVSFMHMSNDPQDMDDISQPLPLTSITGNGIEDYKFGNSNSSIQWSAFNNEDKRYIEINNPPVSRDHLLEEECKFWDQLTNYDYDF